MYISYDGANGTSPSRKGMLVKGKQVHRQGTTIITITLIAYNRYKLILDPAAYNQLYSRRNIIFMLMIAWFIPAVCLIPAVIGVWGKFGYVPMLVTCNLLLDHKSQLFKIFFMVMRAGIPCGLILYFYARIYFATTTSHRRLNQNCRRMSALDLHNQKQEMHMTRMILIIFLVFIISYFPCTVTGLIDWSQILSKHFHMFCQISIYLGSAINPLVYGLMNGQFRQAYTQFICCLKYETLKNNTSSSKDVKNSYQGVNKLCEQSAVITIPTKHVKSVTSRNDAYLETTNTSPTQLTAVTEVSQNSLLETMNQPLLHITVDNRPKFTLE